MPAGSPPPTERKWRRCCRARVRRSVKESRSSAWSGCVRPKPCRAGPRNDQIDEGFSAMKAVVFHDLGDIRIEDVPEPKIQEPTDAIVRLTASAICGTDLHMIRGTMPGMKSGTILGHEG